MRSPIAFADLLDARSHDEANGRICPRRDLIIMRSVDIVDGRIRVHRLDNQTRTTYPPLLNVGVKEILVETFEQCNTPPLVVPN